MVTPKHGDQRGKIKEKEGKRKKVMKCRGCGVMNDVSLSLCDRGRKTDVLSDDME